MSEWIPISAAELRNIEFEKPTPANLEGRRELFKTIVLDCIRCGDTAASAFDYGRRQPELRNMAI